MATAMGCDGGLTRADPGCARAYSEGSDEPASLSRSQCRQRPASAAARAASRHSPTSRKPSRRAATGSTGNSVGKLPVMVDCLPAYPKTPKELVDELHVHAVKTGFMK